MATRARAAAAAAAPPRNAAGMYKDLKVDPELQAAIDGEAHASFAVGLRAVRLAWLDSHLPERKRMGMDQIAHLLGVGRDALDGWWSAYQEGGVEALRGRVEGSGGRPGGGAGSKPGEKAAGPAAGGKTDWTRVCLACAIKAGMVRHVGWHFGIGRVPMPGRRGQHMDIADIPPLPPQRRFPCKCNGDCRTEDGKKRRNCECEPSRQCACPCCRPLTLPPIGPPHEPGCPARAAANTPPHVIAPEDLHRAIMERSDIDYSPDQLHALMTSMEIMPTADTPAPVRRLR